MQKFARFSKRLFSAVPLKDRSIFKISGTDSKKFLQGLCTNDLNSLKTKGDCLATSFLTSKGRIFANTFMYLENDDEILLDVHNASAADLKRHLTVYKLRSKVNISSSKYGIWFQPNGSSAAGESQGTNTILTCPDPRVTDLGHRIIKSLDGEVAAAAEDTHSEWMTTFNLLHGLAEGPEISNRIPLECNLDLLRYISFSKGCYIGQELTARTRYKGLVRKRLVPFLQAKDGEQHVAGNSSAFDLLSSQLRDQILAQTKDGKPYSAGALGGAGKGNKVYHKLGEGVSPVGEVVFTNATGSLGLAMINLDVLLQHQGNFMVLETPATTDEHALSEGNETAPVTAATMSKSEDVRFISTFRPIWFHGLDDKTHLKLNE